MNNKIIILTLLAVTTTIPVLAQNNAPKPKDITIDGVEGFQDTPMEPDGKWHVHDPARPQPPVVTPGSSFSQMSPPPGDATVLFDGKDLSQWRAGKTGGPASWLVENGVAVSAKDD